MHAVRAIALALTCAAAGCAAPRATARPGGQRWCTPGQPCWPSPEAWQALAARLTGTLETPAAMLPLCRAESTSLACARERAAARSPYALQDQPGATQSLGWHGAWLTAPSAKAVAAESAGDVAEAVRFALAHRLRLVVKGTGHDYLGRSNAPDSLLVWTHAMRAVTLHDAFVAQGCAGPGAPAVSVGAGARWLEVYQAVTVKGGRYVQGGGCTSVGAAGGFLQGGGFGSWSKKFGLAAASLIEAEVVLADGSTVIANACQNRDLFWALRGGGGGTFGVVTRATLRTHPLPSHFGWVMGTITARSDAAYRALLERFARFYTERLGNPAWGEQVRVRGDNRLEIAMSFQGMSAEEAERVWAPFHAWVKGQGGRLSAGVRTVAIPAQKMWDAAFFAQMAPEAIRPDPRQNDPGNLFWWTADAAQVAAYWWAYQSRWLPRVLFDDPPKLAALLFAASRHWTLELHFNKGLAGASPEALAESRQTAMNPAVREAAALVISAASRDGTRGVLDDDLPEGERARREVSAAMALIRAATPGAGAYVNEADYFEPDWQRAFWGENYARLLAIKRAVDPDGVFTCHHCVGSE